MLALLKIPLYILRAMRDMAVFVLVMSLIIFISRTELAKETYAPVIGKIEKKTPEKIKKAVLKLAEKTGLKEPEPTFWGVAKKSILKIPSRFFGMLKDIGKIGMHKIVDLLFHPVVILSLGGLAYLRYRR